MNIEVTADTLRAISITEIADCKLKLAIIGYRSTTILAPFLVKALYANGISVELYQGNYKQVEDELLNPASELYAFSPAVVLLINSLEEMRKEWFVEGKQLAENTLKHTQQLKKTLYSHLPSVTLIHENYELDSDGVYGATNEKGFAYQLQKINAALGQTKHPNLNECLFDKATFLAYTGLKNCRNNGMLQSVDLPYTSNTEARIAWELALLIGVRIGRFKKCLILDLDNTLWGGVIGDDGVEGIQIGGTGNGMAFSAIQNWALALKKEGVLLAICSKNTLQLAQEPFLKHPNMILSLSDIAVFVANWSNKAENIKLIKETLNIGYDSLVFIDDNPVERELIKRSFPEVTVPDLPNDAAALPDFLRHLNLFKTANPANETFDRTAFFVQNEARQTTVNETISLHDYLKSLHLKARILGLTSQNLSRVSELSLRSNQFNLCTKRYSIQALQQLQIDSHYSFQTLELEDKFGTYGLIAVLVLKQVNDTDLFIENWFMSCRAIQRGVEELMLNTLIHSCKAKGIVNLRGEYLPTPKNEVVAKHYSTLGFTWNGVYWELNTAAYQPKAVVISII